MRVALALTAAGLAACSCSESGPQEPPNVLLVVLDTVRRDHVSCYGYQLPTTPHLDALAANADRYERCWSTAPWTLPSHASLFTGRYSFEHGARSRMDASGKYHDGIPLAPDHPTLAEALAQEGYDTGAFVANTAYLRSEFGLGQGFDTYEVKRPKKGVEVSAKALDWLDQRASRLPAGTQEARPFFLFVNLMDAHRPYNTTPLEGERSDALPACSDVPSQELLDQLYVEVFEKDGPPPPELVARVTAQYDTGVANADLALGALLDGLRTRGLFEDTLVIVTSDHGEYLGEHDLVEHSKDVYEEALRVPLVVKSAGQEQGRILDGPISLANLPALVLAQLPRAMARHHADDFPNEPGQEEVLAENQYSRSRDLSRSYRERFLRERSVLYLEGRFKFILSSDGQNELYDLAQDPGEQENLLAQKPELARGMEERLRRRLSSASRAVLAGEEPERTPEEEEELRKLGYTGEGESGTAGRGENDTGEVDKR